MSETIKLNKTNFGKKIQTESGIKSLDSVRKIYSPYRFYAFFVF